MKLDGFPGFEEFLVTAEKCTSDALSKHVAAVRILRNIHSTFEFSLATHNPKSVADRVLLISAMHTWLASVREAATGHQSAAMPLFRASLEAACYAYRIWDNPNLQDIWLNRHRDDRSRRLSRKTFGSAVKDTARNLSAREFVWSGTEDWIMACYENTIDFGAHPNPRSILTNLRFDDERADEMIGMSLSAMFGADSFEVKRLLVAGIEYGQVVSLIGCCCTNEPENTVFETLHEINQLKEAYIKTEFEADE